MTAPSNANTSGLSEAWSRLSKTFSDRFYEGYEPEIEAMSAAVVTAASAQARIAELEACAQEESDTLASRLTNAEIIAASWKDRATAAEARADRLAKALVMIGGERPEQKRTYPNSYRGGFDAASDLAASIARAALQQETQK